MAVRSFGGMLGSGDWTIPDNRPTTWFETAFKLDPDNHLSLIYLMSKMKKKVVNDWKFNLHEYRNQVTAYTVDGEVALGAGNDDIVFSGSAAVEGLHAGDILICEHADEERVMITEDPSSPFTTCANVTRYFGSSGNAGVIPDGTVMRWAGNAFEEGATAPSSVHTDTATREQYLQNLLETAEVTEQSKHIESRPFKSMEQSQWEALFRIMVKAESAMFHSIKSQDVGPNGKDRYTMDGLDEMITTNMVDFGGTVTLTEIEDAAEAGMRNGSNIKTLVAGYTAFNVISRAVARNTTGQWELGKTAPKDVTYGLTVRRLETPSGPIDIVRSKKLGESAKFTKRAYLLDMANVMYCHLEGMDITWHGDTAARDTQTDKGHYDGMISIGLALEETHAIWDDMGSYSGP